MNYLKPLTYLVLFFSFTTFAQNTDSEEDNLSLSKGTIDSQFEYVIQKSSSWTNESGLNFRVVKSFWLTDLKAHTLDSLLAARKGLVASEITVKAQSQEINDLKNSLSSVQNNLEKSKSEKDDMSLFGIKMSKSAYSATMWIIIAVLIMLLGLFIYKFKNSNTITKDAKRMLSDLEDEFEEHRKTTVEREQKVRRQLLDEINKQKTIKPKK